MLKFAEGPFGEQLKMAWQDFNMTSLPAPLDDTPGERQIFMPYFLFQWDPQRWRPSTRAACRPGVVTRWYEFEKGKDLSDLQRLLLEQATTQPFNFFEVLWSEPGERIWLRDILLGAETEVVERTGSKNLQRGDILYGQIWNLRTLSVMGCMAPFRIPPRWKADVITLRAKLRKTIAKEKRDLDLDDLRRNADMIRLTYLTIRDALFTPPQLANTDGDPIVFHTLKFRIESAEKAFKALAPLAFGQSRKYLLESAEFGKDGELQRIEFDWCKKGNAKNPNWDNTILGNIKIAGRSLTAEVNSEKRAKRLRAEIEKRLGASALHQRTAVKTVEEMTAKASNRTKAQAKSDDDIEQALLHDPEARSRLQELIQKQVEEWVHQKVPALGGRTPLQAVEDADGREAVEALLLDWERGGAYQAGIRPDFNAVRRLLKLPPTAP